MFAHWRYIFDRLLGPIAAVSCRHMTALPQRIDEAGPRYDVDVEDHAFARFELEAGALAQIGSASAARGNGAGPLQAPADRPPGSARPAPQPSFRQPPAAA